MLELFQIEQYGKELEDIRDLSREECVTYLRRYVINLPHLFHCREKATTVICLILQEEQLLFKRSFYLQRSDKVTCLLFVLLSLLRLQIITFLFCMLY
jgi:hypothetical protein